MMSLRNHDCPRETLFHVLNFSIGFQRNMTNLEFIHCVSNYVS